MSHNETYEVQRKNPETGESEVVTELYWKYSETLENEYKQKASDLAEIIQISVCPLISEFPFLSKSVLSEVIPFLGVGIQPGKLHDYKEALEKDLMVANQEIDQYKRKVAGL